MYFDNWSNMITMINVAINTRSLYITRLVFELIVVVFCFKSSVFDGSVNSFSIAASLIFSTYFKICGLI